uniref:Uncharacterized protein n=1 Tax=Arundo donax TaxID=35708 RepID=A0A0A9AQA2_ARUDO
MKNKNVGIKIYYKVLSKLSRNMYNKDIDKNTKVEIDKIYNWEKKIIVQ